jgi:protein-disulfide isomerase
MKNTYKLTRRTMMTRTGAFAGAGLITIGLNAGTTAHAATDLEAALAPRILGNPDAPILMAEYFSLSCSHCADFHHGTFKDIKANWIDTGKMRFEMRDFPLQGPAIYAHALARSVPVNAYFGMIDVLFAKQREWASAEDPIAELAGIARIAGIGESAFAEILENRPLLEGIVAILQKGHDTYQISATPSFVINEERVLRGGGNYDRFLSVLNEFAA